jgi:hypothetical protein
VVASSGKTGISGIKVVGQGEGSTTFIIGKDSSVTLAGSGSSNNIKVDALDSVISEPAVVTSRFGVPLKPVNPNDFSPSKLSDGAGSNNFGVDL